MSTVTHESHAFIANIVGWARNTPGALKSIVILTLHAIVTERCIAAFCAIITGYTITLDTLAINARSSIGTRDTLVVFTQIIVTLAGCTSKCFFIAFCTIG